MRFLFIILIFLNFDAYSQGASNNNHSSHAKASKESIILHVIYESVHHDVDPALVMAIIKKESGWRHLVLGDDGKSFGLMQIRCSTARDMGFKKSCRGLLNFKDNIKFSVKYLKERIKMYGFNNGIAAYNSGSPVYNNKGILINQKYVNDVIKHYEYYKIIFSSFYKNIGLSVFE